VVLVHGFSVPYFVWDPTFDALVQAGFHVLRYDLYGRGYSDRPAVTYDYDLFDRQLVELLDALDIETPVDVVGLSMGGAVSVTFTDRHPERVRRLALISPVGLPIDNPLKKIVEVPIVGELIFGFGGGQLLISTMGDDVAGNLDLTDYIRRYKETMQYQGFLRALLSTMRAGVITNARGAFAGVGRQDTPVLLIWGTLDQTVPYGQSDEVRRLVPQAEFHPIEGAGHISHYEKAEIVNPLLVEFFSR
jgi:pimeloyl-ACP methyl ester carboxylesterase